MFNYHRYFMKKLKLVIFEWVTNFFFKSKTKRMCISKMILFKQVTDFLSSKIANFYVQNLKFVIFNPIPYGPIPNLFPMGVGRDRTWHLQLDVNFWIHLLYLSHGQMDKASAFWSKGRRFEPACQHILFSSFFSSFIY